MSEHAHFRALDSSVRVVVLTDSGAIPSLYVRWIDPLPLVTQNYNIIHSETPGADVIAASADVLVLQRWFNTPIRRLAEDAKRRGVPLIYETDDNLLDLPEQSQNRFSTAQLNNIRIVTGLADIVVCSTEPLADFLRSLNPDVKVLRNYGLPKTPVNQDGPPHLAIVNTDYFKLDSGKSGFFRALQRAVESCGYDITFFGSLDPLAAELCAAFPNHVFHDTRYVDDRLMFIDMLARSGVNVAAIPLSDTRQHAYKSDVKFLDFASIGIPGVYNNRTVYPDVQSGIDGLLCEDSAESWFKALQAFAGSTFRRECGLRALSAVESGRSLPDYARELADVMARLASGESGASIAPSAQAVSGHVTPPGLLWSEGHLYVSALGKRRHLNKIELIPTCLEAGLCFLGPEEDPVEVLDEGPQLNTESQLTELLHRSRLAPSQQMAEGHRLRISWISPNLIIGGGGHRNIIRCAYQLERLGHEVSIYFIGTELSSKDLSSQVREHFYPFEGFIGRWDEASPAGDVIMATHWSTITHAEDAASEFGEIVYFVQDFEPSFYALGSEYVLAESTYRRGYYAITSGLWCENFLKQNFGAEADHFRFPVDKEIYYERPQLRRENRLLFFAKPEMTRRCFELGVAALARLHQLRPEVEIGFYGSSHAVNVPTGFPVTHYGLLPGPNELAELYASSKVGVVFSTTNPSLVPYEMMACGLPVVDLRRPGNEANYGGRYDIAFLADPEPSRMAAEIAQLLDDGADIGRRSAAGLEFAAGFPVEQEVGTLIESYIRRRVDAWNPERRRRTGGRS